MPRNTSKSELKNEVVGGMRRYLGHHPQMAFQTAIDLTALVVERSTSKALLEWRDRLVDLNKYGSDNDLVYPEIHTAAKRSPKRRRSPRKA